ncbi:MAG: hypothetical protein ACQEQ4_02300 [Fibrobacterota bacterium]
MSKEKLHLIEQALKKHAKILPCGTFASLMDCFTQEEGRLFFWFNTPDNSTHAVYEDLS